MQSGCVVIGFSGDPPILSKRNVGQSGKVYQLSFLGMLNGVTKCSFPQMKVLPCKHSRELLTFMEIEMAVMPGKRCGIARKKCAARDVVSIPVPLLWEKKRERRAIRRDRIVVGGREIEAAEKRPKQYDVVKHC